MFKTIRSLMGRYLYELKYGQTFSAKEQIIKLLSENKDFIDFISSIDVILPVPPSNKYRRLQPVVLVAQEIARIFSKELRQDILIYSNSEEIKNIDMNEKYERIRSLISIEGQLDISKNTLIFDDVFDSGSTLTAMTNALIKKGYANIFVFTLTKTKGSPIK